MKLADRIQDMRSWSHTKDKSCEDMSRIPATFCRNWRTWLGHSNVADGVTALAAIPLLFTTASWAVVLGIVGWLAGCVFYVNKEFNPWTGNFFDKSENKNEKQTDSVLDAMVPVFTSSFLKFNFIPGALIALTAIQTAVTYLVYRMDSPE